MVTYTTSHWMLLLLVAAIAGMVQSVFASSIPPLANATFIFKQIVLPDSTEVPITKEYIMIFLPTESETEFGVSMKIGNNMHSTMTINSTIVTDEETILNVGMDRLTTTLMMPPEAEMLVEDAIGEILPTVDTVVVVEKNDTTLTVTFEGDGGGIIVLDQEVDHESTS